MESVMSIVNYRIVAVLSLATVSLPFLLLTNQAFSRLAWGQDTPKTSADKKDTDAKKEPTDEKSVRALIAQLGDNSFDKREDADKRLAAIGEPALILLEKTAQDSSDAEVRYRAGQLILAINKGMFTQVRQLGVHEGKSLPKGSRVVVTLDGRRAISIGGDALLCWDLADGKRSVTFDPRSGQMCWAFAMSADGKRIIAGCHGKTVYVFDVATGKKVKTINGHTAPVWGVALTADGTQAITGAGDKTIKVWDVASGKEVRTFEEVVEELRCLALSPDGKIVAAGHFGGTGQPATLRLWDFASGKEIRALKGHQKEISWVAFSRDGKTLASTSFDTTVRLWDVATGKELKVLEGHTNWVECAAFTPDGKRLVSCGNNQSPTVKIWDVASGKMILESEPVPGGFHGVAMHPDGRQCVTVGRDGSVRLWQWKR
jgi:WD40 repeat protein